MASEVAKESAIAKKVDVRLAPVPAYTDYGTTPMVKDTVQDRADARSRPRSEVVDLVVANKEVLTVNASVQLGNEWKYFASSEGSYIEQEVYPRRRASRDRAQEWRDEMRNFTGVRAPVDGKSAEAAGMVEAAERIAAEAVEFCTAKPVEMGMKDLILTPSHGDCDDPTRSWPTPPARSHHGLRGQLRRQRDSSRCRPRQTEVRVEAVQRHRRPNHPDGCRDDRV